MFVGRDNVPLRCLAFLTTLLPLVCSQCYDSSFTTSSESSNSFDSSTPVRNNCTADFLKYFESCKRSSPTFDKCIRTALNSVTPYFTTGVPDLKIPPFDPWFAEEIIQKWGGPGIGYNLKLRNVREAGWKQSLVTKFRSNAKAQMIVYTQYFPEKYLEGEWEAESNLIQQRENRGVFNLTLYEYNQTTTIYRSKNTKRLKVNIQMKEVGNLKLHISNLLRGRTFLEGILDRMINGFWRPGLVFVRPMVNDVVSTAFTDIYNKHFNDFDLNTILPAE
ncbi:unnamed protein product [Bemisia tabaci]|uniref:Uncharacterized protein n=1 Tax=Bemisia tabaci TaxID=7038 RepID=A0A9P0F8Z8_BEMTA|nr:PREDICTED: uncharacterized protein LOC109029657 [Bemisia tabaci]CAH0393035.1 unnamed protein product [Bemisia tabaci]